MKFDFQNLNGKSGFLIEAKNFNEALKDLNSKCDNADNLDLIAIWNNTGNRIWSIYDGPLPKDI